MSTADDRHAPPARIARRLHRCLDPPECVSPVGRRLFAVDGLRLVAALLVVA
ncbi:hypothetical protein [Streptomyces sp. NPDC048641]